MDLVELKQKLDRCHFETELQEEQFLEVRDAKGKRIYISASEPEYEVAHWLDKWLVGNG